MNEQAWTPHSSYPARDTTEVGSGVAYEMGRMLREHPELWTAEPPANEVFISMFDDLYKLGDRYIFDVGGQGVIPEGLQTSLIEIEVDRAAEFFTSHWDDQLHWMQDNGLTPRATCQQQTKMTLADGLTKLFKANGLPILSNQDLKDNKEGLIIRYRDDLAVVIEPVIGTGNPNFAWRGEGLLNDVEAVLNRHPLYTYYPNWFKIGNSDDPEREWKIRLVVAYEIKSHYPEVDLTDACRQIIRLMIHLEHDCDQFAREQNEQDFNLNVKARGYLQRAAWVMAHMDKRNGRETQEHLSKLFGTLAGYFRG